MTNLKLAIMALAIISNAMALPPAPKGENLDKITYTTYTCVDSSNKKMRLDFTKHSNIRYQNYYSIDYADDVAIDIRELHYFKSIYQGKPSGEYQGKPYYTIGDGVTWAYNCEFVQPRTGNIEEPKYVKPEEILYSKQVFSCNSKKFKNKKLTYMKVIQGEAQSYLYYGRKTNSNTMPVVGRYKMEYKSILANTPTKGKYISGHMLKWQVETCKKLSTTIVKGK